MKWRPWFVKNAPLEDHGFQNWTPWGSLRSLNPQWPLLCTAPSIPKAEPLEQMLLKWYSSQNPNKESYIHHPHCCFPSLALPSRQNILAPPSILYTVVLWKLSQIWGSQAGGEKASRMVGMVAFACYKHHQTCEHLLWVVPMIIRHDGEYRSLRLGPCPHYSECMKDRK
jgi:hypothetical protein